MPYTTIASSIFGKPYQDMSIGLIEIEEDGSQLVGQYDYSSEVVPAWRCKNEASVQFFAHRFVHILDSWHDTFAVGPVFKTTLSHRPGSVKVVDYDITTQETHEIEISFAGWHVSRDDLGDRLFADLDDAVEYVNRHAPR